MIVNGVFVSNPLPWTKQSTEAPTAAGLLALVIEGPITTANRPLTIITLGQPGK
jgi:hypothetical protein